MQEESRQNGLEKSIRSNGRPESFDSGRKGAQNLRRTREKRRNRQFTGKILEDGSHLVRDGRSGKRLRLPKRIVHRVYRSYVDAIRKESKEEGFFVLEKQDLKDLQEVLRMNLSGVQLRRINCLVALNESLSLTAVCRKYDVELSFVTSLLTRMRREGFRAAILRKTCPLQLEGQREQFRRAIPEIAEGPLPAGHLRWTHAALSECLKQRFELLVCPDRRTISALLDDIKFIKWKGRFVLRKSLR